jgi:inner membrane protein
MDTLTHALSGALAARATAPARPGAVPLWQRVTLGFAVAAFPDVDVVLALASPVTYITQHRGLTHSLVMLPLWSWLLAWLAALTFRNRAGLREYFWVSALCIAVHILGDWVTSFGTMFLAPLSRERFALGSTFIIDLWFSGIILAGLAASSAWRESRLPAVAACALLAGYVGFQLHLKGEAEGVGREYAANQGLSGATVRALPRPVSPYNWTVVVEHEGRYRYAHLNLRRIAPPAAAAPDAGQIARIDARFQPVALTDWHADARFGPEPVDVTVVRAAWNTPGLGFYRWFAEFPALYRIDRGNPHVCVWFQDLRFIVPGRDHVPFRYGACSDDGGPWRAHLLDGGGRIAVE